MLSNLDLTSVNKRIFLVFFSPGVCRGFVHLLVPNNLLCRPLLRAASLHKTVGGGPQARDRGLRSGWTSALPKHQRGHAKVECVTVTITVTLPLAGNQLQAPRNVLLGVKPFVGSLRSLGDRDLLHFLDIGCR